MNVWTFKFIVELYSVTAIVTLIHGRVLVALAYEISIKFFDSRIAQNRHVRGTSLNVLLRASSVASHRCFRPSPLLRISLLKMQQKKDR